MKIYFEDGELLSPQIYNINYVVLDAKYGPTYCEKILDKCRRDKSVDAIYTNYVQALSSIYGWNSETEHIDVFLRHPMTQEWTDIDKFTNKIIYNILIKEVMIC